jgi:hypothetical protein
MDKADEIVRVLREAMDGQVKTPQEESSTIRTRKLQERV